MADDDGRHTGDGQLFVIFAFTILCLLLVPLTWWRVASGASGQVVVQPWQKKHDKKPLSTRLRGLMNAVNFCLALGWLVVIGLGVYIATVDASTPEPFDPFAILQLPENADSAAIKKAYRALSRQYHPDKNPDPAAATYFAEKITKAYQALTDETSRENYLKHGHPDGPQAMHIGVALPQWFFASDKRVAPLMLLALSFLGLAVPILAVSCYLWQTEGYVGSNQIMEATLFMYHRHAVKELMRVTKMPEAIVMANEFVVMGFKRQTTAAFQKFVNAMQRTYQLNEKALPKWWPPAVLRSYLFIVAYLDRNGDIVPSELNKDYFETLRLAHVLCEEFVKAACAPRNRLNQGWFVPAEAAAQFSQCIAQQVRPEVLCPSADDKKKKKSLAGEGAASLLQLPGIGEEVVRALERKSKVRTLEDLVGLSDVERDEALRGAGVEAGTLPELATTLLSLPHAHITSAKAFVQFEEDIKESDIVTVQLHIAVTRASHGEQGEGDAVRARLGAGVQAYAPRFPHFLTEKWFVFVADTKASTPAVWCHTQVQLLEGEVAGLKHFAQLGCKWGSSAAGAARLQDASAKGLLPGNEAPVAEDGEPVGQLVEFKFMAAEAGKSDLQVVLMPSTWFGCNVVKPFSLVVQKQSAAERQGRGARGPKGAALDEDNGAADAPQKAKAEARAVDSDEDDDDADDGTAGDDESEGWDTEETGTDISHEEEEDGG